MALFPLYEWTSISLILLASGVLFSRLLNPRPMDALPAWIGGLFLALLLVPAVLYVGARVFSLRISIPAVVAGAALLLLAAYFAGRPPVRRIAGR